MGLLTDAKSREKVSDIVLKWQKFLTFVLFFGGAVGFLVVSYQPFNNKTYFSENALLAGLVDDLFDFSGEAKNYYNHIKEEAKKKKNAKYLPADYLMTEFAKIGLEAYTQNFSYKYPLEMLDGEKTYGKNVYGILRAPKSASTEAIVISAPFRSVEDPRPSTNAGIALMIALAKYFRGHTYWAKDVIFLITQHEEIGMQAWLDAYHRIPNLYIRSSGLEARGGSIQAALNLELLSSNIDHMDIKFTGLNGQLPNLDLVNVVVHLCEKAHIRTSINSHFDHYAPLSQDGAIQSLKTYMAHMWSQLKNTPNGNHGLFHKYRIEALTIVGVRSKSGGHEKGFNAQGRVIEGVVRSLNNLLERFHQSFFFYLLPASHRYVSIGVYIGPFAAMVGAALVQALSLWLQVTDEEERKESGSGDNKDKIRKLDAKYNKNTSKFWAALPTILMSQVFALGAYLGPQFFIWAGKFLSLPPDESLAVGCAALGLSAIMFPYMMRRKMTDSPGNNDWRIVKCFALLYQATVLYGTSVMNISLAYCLAVTMLPMSLLVRPVRTTIARLFFSIPLLITSPLALLFASSLIQVLKTHPLKSAMFIFDHTLNQFKDCILWSVVDWYLFGNWIYQLIACLIFPNWLMYWALLWSK